MGSLISASDTDEPAIEDDMSELRIPKAASLGLLPDRIIPMLGAKIGRDELQFSNRLLEVVSRVSVNTLLAEFKQLAPEKRQTVRTAIFVMSVRKLERAGRVNQEVLWTTARLVDFWLGDCFLPVTHAWLEGDPQRLKYLRNPAVAQSVIDGRDNPHLVAFAEGFVQGARAFGQTYCNLYDLILMQDAFDESRIFDGVRGIPPVEVIFSRAIAQHWKPVEMEFEAAEEMAARDADRHSASGATSTTGTITVGLVLQTLTKRTFSGSGPVTEFADRLFCAPKRGDFPLADLLGLYARLDGEGQGDVLKAVIVRALAFLDTTDISRQPLSLWITARFAAFLLSNGLLPPLHDWLYDVTVDMADADASSNVSALQHLMAPRNGILNVAMESFEAGEVVPELAGSSTSIFGLTEFFKKVAAKFDDAYRTCDLMSKTQFFMDEAKFSKRFRPNPLDVLDIAVQMARTTDAERIARAEVVKRVSPDKAGGFMANPGGLGREHRSDSGERDLVPRVGGDASASLLVTPNSPSVNSGDASDAPPPRPWWKRYICCCC